MSYAPLPNIDVELNDLTPQTAPPPLSRPVYDRGRPKLILLGLIFTLLLGIGLLVGGVYVSFLGPLGTNEGVVQLRMASSVRLVVTLALDVAITVGTEAAGVVHGSTLKWALAAEHSLRFNANIRLFRASGGAFSVNGWVVNLVFAVSLILAYASSSAIVVSTSDDYDVQFVSPCPLIFAGITILLQAVLGLLAYFRTPVSTWSSSPLDVAAACVDDDLVDHMPQRCMRSVADSTSSRTSPIRPSAQQPSAWESHKAVQRIVWLSWALVPAGIVWAGVLMLLNRYDQDVLESEWGGGALNEIAVIPNGLWTPRQMIGQIFIAASIQSVLTMGLHCCELVVTLSRDEAVWREGSSEKGARMSGNPLVTAVGSWQSGGLLVAKPVLHWMFGNAVRLTAEGLVMNPGWVLGLCGGVVPVAGFVTFVATRHPTGPQPCAYGHIQTLANLVDEWVVPMYWGHKADASHGLPAHAGTSSERLPQVYSDVKYAGSVFESGGLKFR